MSSPSEAPLFLRACRREPVERTPLWIMRQAGRYLASYRDVRARHSFLEMCRTPEIAAEVTLLPFRELDLDAAIIFSDILIPVAAMGVPVEFVLGEGPRLPEPVRTIERARSLREPDPERDLGFVLDAIRQARRALAPGTPLLGFAGAPFTLACYMVEGGSSKGYERPRAWLHRDPDGFREMLGVLGRTVARYLSAQIAAGADAVQLFDTWAGTLGREEYRRVVLPVLQETIAAIERRGAPVILYANGVAPILEEMAESGADVVSVDWRIPMSEARRRAGSRVVLQGNLDPCVLHADEATIRRHACAVLAAFAGEPGHVFNLGHGILPDVSPDAVRALIRAVREESATARGIGPGLESGSGAGAGSGAALHPVPRVDRALLAKYDVPGPRYTSYPTAPSFHAGFDAAEHERALRETSLERSPRPLSLYVHLPFCEKLCWFCGCNMRVAHDRTRAGAYLDALEREADRVAPLVRGRPAVQIHFGGGTPNFLEPAQIDRLAALLRSRFDVPPECELGVEVDPRGLTQAHLDAFGRAGMNRLSMGVQDFEPLVQEAINRVQSEEATRFAVEAGRRAGATSVNIDLIYGLPHQTPETFARTLERVLAIGPDRLAVFNFAYLPETIKHQKVIARDALPAPESKLEILHRTFERLVEAGYAFIGMDHFARPGDELARAQREGTLWRNFQGYTTRKGVDLIGLGVSAISQVGPTYAQNLKDLPEYEACVRAGRLATMRGYRLSAEDELRRSVIMDIISHFRLDLRRFAARHGVAFALRFAEELRALEPMHDDGLVEWDEDELRVTETGRMLVRNVCMAFDANLRAAAARRPSFSRTV